VKWCYDLRTLAVAIICFRDHIEGNVYRTADGHLHETLAAAQDHRRHSFAELFRDRAAARVIDGALIGRLDRVPILSHSPSLRQLSCI
jgi:hypothetical protein